MNNLPLTETEILSKNSADTANIDTVFDELREIRIHGDHPGYSTGWGYFDKYFKFPPFGQLNVVTGCPGCFKKEQLIHTKTGVKPIGDVNPGDMVLSYNHEKRINEYRKVTATPVHKNHKGTLLKIKMKDGTIIVATDNHKFYTGTRYVKIKELLNELRK